jgi:cytochrome c553
MIPIFSRWLPQVRSSLVLLLTAVLFAPIAHAQNEAEVLFDARCARCHGHDGAGKTAAGQKLSMPDLRSAQVQKLTEEGLFDTIANGTRHHKYPHVFKSMGLSDAQIRQLVKHVREFGKTPLARTPRPRSGSDKGGPSSH